MQDMTGATGFVSDPISDSDPICVSDPSWSPSLGVMSVTRWLRSLSDEAESHLGIQQIIEQLLYVRHWSRC